MLWAEIITREMEHSILQIELHKVYVSWKVSTFPAISTTV